MNNLSSTKRSVSLPPQQQVETRPNENLETYSSPKATMTSYDALKVAIRIRPPISREIDDGLPFRSIVKLYLNKAIASKDGKTVSLAEYVGSSSNELERQKEWVDNQNNFQLYHFTFDNIFDTDSTQKEVYEHTAKPAVLSILEGYNSTIFAYGQTGTGKTFTMEGFTYSNTDEKRGIIPRSIEEIFNYIESYSNNNAKFMVRASYLQIYNEAVSDLLKSERVNLNIREDKKKGVFVEVLINFMKGLSEWAVRNPGDIYSLLQKGTANRETSSTKMNDFSSRSHAVFVIVVEQMIISPGNNKSDTKTQIKVGKLNLVDLAGSERIRHTGSTGKQLEESKKINKSLSALGNVIYALTDTKNRGHIPYRDSKLTRLLEDSLGGNCKTTMMAMISPSADFFHESLSTLNFARRAKTIKNRPKINEDVDHKALIREYEVELKKLRNELEEKNRLIHSNELVIKLDEQRKRAEEDKQAAIVALEQASRQYLFEREEKKKLEQKIKIMNSQMITGGHKGEDSNQLKILFEEKQNKLIKEFDAKFQEFEKERQIIEEEKAQVERYKQLLLKQRDIMIALTSKLNERDENIVQLQEEIEAYEKINKDLEENIESKNLRIEIMENVLKSNGLKIDEAMINKTINLGSRKNEKMYIPYSIEKNEKEFENSPTILLSSEEKIQELNIIVKEQEVKSQLNQKEIDILKLISSKIMNNSNNPDFFKTNNFLDFKEYREKNTTLEKEKMRLLNEIKEKDSSNNHFKSWLEKLLINIKSGNVLETKSIQGELENMYNHLNIGFNRDSINSFNDEKSIRMTSSYNEEKVKNKNSQEIKSKPPVHSIKNLQNYNPNEVKESNSKTKSANPPRPKDFEKSNDSSDLSKLNPSVNIKVGNVISEQKIQKAGNLSSKSMIDGVYYDNLTNKSNNSLNTSGFNLGTKKTDLNKFLNFNK